MKRLLLFTIFVMSAIWSSSAYADNLGTWEIDDQISFTASIFNTTGESTVPDASPTYRIYQGLSDTAIANGTLTKLDVSNLTAIYGATETLSSGNGYSAGQYWFTVEAVVDGVTGEASLHNFQIRDFADYKADVSSLATATNLQTVDDNVDAVKAKTDNLTFTTANKVDARVDYVGTNAVTTPNDFKADVSNLDAAVSTRSTFDNTSDQVIVTTNNDKTGYALTGSYLTETETNALIERATGDVITSIGSLSIPTVNQIVAGIWAESLPGSFNSGEAGYILGTNLNATVSSRSSHTAGDVWASGTRTLTDPNSYKADVSSLAIEANVETHVTNSLGSYDPPTKSEMDAGFLAAEATPEAILVDTDRLLSVSPEIELDGSVYRLTTNALEQAPAGGSVDYTTVEAVLTHTTKLISVSPEIELDGSVYRFTTNALEQGPSGDISGVGDWTATEKKQIRSAIGINGASDTAYTTDGLLNQMWIWLRSR